MCLERKALGFLSLKKIPMAQNTNGSLQISKVLPKVHRGQQSILECNNPKYVNITPMM